MLFALPTLLLCLVVRIEGFATLEHLERLARGQLEPATQDELSRRSVEDLREMKRNSGFNAAAQLIDVYGKHAYVPASGDDLRGPCPGLNALANHYYIPHSGIGTLTEYIDGCMAAFNMDITLSTTLSAYGVLTAGNLISLDPKFSMGQPTSRVENILGNALGLFAQPGGLSGSHNVYEADSSLSRGDLYSTGNNDDLNMDTFMALWNLQKDEPDPNYSVDVIFQHAVNQYHNSIATNPWFWNGPVTTLVKSSAFQFTARLLANYSAEYPVDGRLTKENMKSLFGITGEEGSFKWTYGTERIPENYYRRPNPYSLVELFADLGLWALAAPEIFSIGGNTGTVNSFAGADLHDPAGGVLNLAHLLEGDKGICFALSVVTAATPTILHTFYAIITQPLALVMNQIGIASGIFSCPPYQNIIQGSNFMEHWKSKFPGARKSGLAV